MRSDAAGWAGQARCLVFLHLPKTAGSTLTTVLRWQYRSLGPDQLLRTAPERAGADQIAALPSGRRARLRVVTGHVAYGIHELLPVPCDYITLVREPVQRVVSVYRYILSAPTHPMHHAVVGAGLSLERFVASGLQREQVDNAFTRQLTGRWDADLTRDDLGLARERLAGFLGVGLTERFDETLVLLKHQLGWGTPFYFRRNVSRAGPPAERVPQRVLDRIREHNALDVELYELATDLFETAVAAEPTGFDREVRRFRRLNRVPDALSPVLEGLAPQVRRVLERWAAARASFRHGT